MKKMTRLLVALLGIGLTGCGSPSIEDVSVSEIKDACGCAEAVEMVSGGIVTELGKYDNNLEKLNENSSSKEIITTGKTKLKEILKQCEEKLEVTMKELEKCPSFEAGERNMNFISLITDPY